MLVESKKQQYVMQKRIGEWNEFTQYPTRLHAYTCFQPLIIYADHC